MRRKMEERNFPFSCPSCGHPCRLEVPRSFSIGGRHRANPSDWAPAPSAAVRVGAGAHVRSRYNIYEGYDYGMLADGAADIDSEGDQFDVDVPFGRR
jgi:hypothetical protein